MVLEEIVKSTHERVESAKKAIQIDEIKGKAEAKSNPLSFYNAVARLSGISLIAEAKKASPSAGVLRQDYDIAELARTYERSGAVAMSVLTEPTRFMGDKSHVEIAAKNCSLPILQKDFFIDECQIYESKLLGASAVLLIAAILDNDQINNFMAIAKGLGMDAVVEVHIEEELKRVLDIRPEIIGINNRNLKDFTVNLETSIELGILAKESGAKIIAESGIKTRKDVIELEVAGFDAILVGSHIVGANDPGRAIKELLGLPY